jgi:hypothetical protein
MSVIPKAQSKFKETTEDIARCQQTYTIELCSRPVHVAFISEARVSCLRIMKAMLVEFCHENSWTRAIGDVQYG